MVLQHYANNKGLTTTSSIVCGDFNWNCRNAQEYENHVRKAFPRWVDADPHAEYEGKHVDTKGKTYTAYPGLTTVRVSPKTDEQPPAKKDQLTKKVSGLIDSLNKFKTTLDNLKNTLNGVASSLQ